MQLLHIDSSISGEQSISRQLTASIVSHLKHNTSGLDVVYHDLGTTPVPHHSPALWQRKLQALTADETEQAREALISDEEVAVERDFAAVNAALDEFLAADIVVIGAPMYNFAIPSQLKTWIDSISVSGKTFHYTAQGPEGLCSDKKVIIASSRGGIYNASSPFAALDHQESYLTSIFNFIGVSNLTFVRAEGVNMGNEQRQHALSAALAQVATLQAATLQAA
jgi:FMN-dependent NADH-azoreductase